MDLDGWLFDEPEEIREDPLPETTGDFLHWLDECWPHRCPGRGISLEEIHRYAGARALIDKLMFRMFGPDKSKWKPSERKNMRKEKQ